MRNWKGPLGRCLPAAVVAATAVGLLMQGGRVGGAEPAEAPPAASLPSLLTPPVYLGAAPAPPLVPLPVYFFAGVAAGPQRPRINHVLIISEDGMRADAVTSLHLK
jgi:hypothetical protein